MSWKDNSAMFWSVDGTTWNKISDHNRSSIEVNYERIGSSERMVDGTMRRQSVAKKRTISTSWTMFPSKRNAVFAGKTGITTADGGWAGEDIENFQKTNDGMFYVKLRKGSDQNKAITDNDIERIPVMFTDFNKSIEKRGTVDLWSLSITLEEV